MIDRRLIQNFDWVLLGLVVIICATGIVNLYSAGYNRGEGTPLYIKQLYWLAVGLGVMFVTLTYDYRHLEKLSYPFYIISILLLVAVMFGGKVVSGSRRWLPLGPLAFQPSELAKIAMNVHGSYGLMDDYKISRIWKDVIFGPQVEGVSPLLKVLVAGEILRG